MKHLKIILVLFTLGILLITQSCVKDIDIDYGSFESKLVLNAMVSTSENWSIKLAKSGSALSNIDTIANVDDATVIVTDYTSNKTISLTAQGNGIYKNENETPIAGHSYEVKVSHPHFSTIYASTVIPHTVEIEEVSRTIFINEKGEDTIRIVIEVSKNNLDIPYYTLEWNKIQSNGDGEETIIQDDRFIAFDTGANQLDRDIPHGIRFIIGNNDDGDGPNQNLTAVLSTIAGGSNGNGGDGSSNDKELTMELRVVTISQSYFDYYTSLDLIRKVNYNSDYKKSSKTLFSNVENGYGILGSYNVQIHQF